MKFVKKAGKKIIKMSKREWLSLGKKAGWLSKKAMDGYDDLDDYEFNQGAMFEAPEESVPFRDMDGEDFRDDSGEEDELGDVLPKYETSQLVYTVEGDEPCAILKVFMEDSGNSYKVFFPQTGSIKKIKEEGLTDTPSSD
jgi:hypothetical protein